MKIIHLSDLHVGYRNMGERFNCIVNNIIYLKEPPENYVIIFTGDLVETATNPSNYEEAKSYIDKLEVAGFKVLVVPGNHDYGTGAWGSEKYVSLFKQIFFNNTQIHNPKLDIVGDIAFIGLDTMAEELNWYDRMFAEGELGDSQLDQLDALLESSEVKACKYRVVYIHHHVFHPRPLGQLKDAEKLGKKLRPQNIDALLYSHNHTGGKHNGKWGIHRCYDCGTATCKDNGNHPHRVIDLERDARCDYDAEFLTPCNDF